MVETIIPSSCAPTNMVETDTATILALMSVAIIAYFIVTSVPRVDAMSRSYRKFTALTTLGITYIILIGLFMAILISIDGQMIEAIILALGVATFLLFGLSLLYDVADDWLRLFADPEFNTLVEISLVLAVVVFLVISFLAIET